MSYTLTLGYIHLLPPSGLSTNNTCSCEEARKSCSPTYVFSIVGQIGFRQALTHLTTCNKQECRQLRVRVLAGMTTKLRWLFEQERLLGCVHVQPYLYGTRRVLLGRQHFPAVAHHLAHCPKESCAQLRRALLLTVREKVRPTPLPLDAPVP